jgi:hypothetical protein
MFEAAGSGRSGSPPSGQALSVCGFSEAVLLGQPEADGMLLVPPAHPLIAYTGRVDCSTKEAVGFAHAGAAVRLRFTGKALDFSYRDHGNETPTGTNYFMVSVDQRAPFPVKLSPKQERYAVVRNLSEGDHGASFSVSESTRGRSFCRCRRARIVSSSSVIRSRAATEPSSRRPSRRSTTIRVETRVPTPRGQP